MSLEAETALLVGLYLLGAVARIVWPYLLAYLQDEVSFDIKFIIGQVVAAIIGLFGIMAAKDFVGDLGAVGFFSAFVLGYGAASIGRDSQKTTDRIRG